MISNLQDELIATRTQLPALRKFTPSNPQIDVYQTRVSGLEQEIRDASTQVAGVCGAIDERWRRLSLHHRSLHHRSLQRQILSQKLNDVQLECQRRVGRLLRDQHIENWIGRFGAHA